MYAGSISRPNRLPLDTSPRTHLLVFERKNKLQAVFRSLYSSPEHLLVRNTINFINNNQVDTGLIQTKDVCTMRFACTATSKSR